MNFVRLVVNKEKGSLTGLPRMEIIRISNVTSDTVYHGNDVFGWAIAPKWQVSLFKYSSN